MRRVATYRTRILDGIVVNTLTEHERKLRRLHVHVGDYVALPSAYKLKCQVEYVIKGPSFLHESCMRPAYNIQMT